MPDSMVPSPTTTAQRPPAGSSPQPDYPPVLPQTIRVGAHEVKLTRAEAAIFYQLYASKNEVCGRDRLQDAVEHYVGQRPYETKPGSITPFREYGSIYVLTHHIRKKLDEADRQNFPHLGYEIITTAGKQGSYRSRRADKQGKGYVLEVPKKYSLSLADGVYSFHHNTLG